MKMTLESVFKEPETLCVETAREVEPKHKALALSLYAVCGSALYGFTMGLHNSLLQAAVSAVKVPALFLVTLCITLPTLHFIGLLFGSKVRFVQSLIILLAGISLTSTLLGAFAPISLLFLASGSDYPFLLLMHVAIFAFCGGAGLYAVNRTFAGVQREVSGGKSSGHVLKAWMFLYMFVGTQTAYLLSPFVSREPGFILFHGTGGNFYTYLWSVIQELWK
ncbi:MAG: actin-binding WH2 domain-containing protein [Planctomycetes bacterium]|nr:actin-binding WH2 domain-containing protein [Planctomycetota bacterium]